MTNRVHVITDADLIKITERNGSDERGQRSLQFQEREVGHLVSFYHVCDNQALGVGRLPLIRGLKNDANAGISRHHMKACQYFTVRRNDRPRSQAIFRDDHHYGWGDTSINPGIGRAAIGRIFPQRQLC